MSSKGCTELKISLSRAKNVKETAGDVRFCVFPQKTSKNAKKLIFSTKFSEIFRTCPNASERIQMHPNASECIRAHPNRSEQVRKPRKTCENVEKLAKNSRTLRKNFRIFSRRLVLNVFGCVWMFSGIFRKFLDVFASFSRFSDLLGPTGTCSDALGCVRTRPENFGNFG